MRATRCERNGRRLRYGPAVPPGPYVRPIAVRVGFLSWLSNVAGAVLAFFFLTFLSPDRVGGGFSSEDRISLTVFVVYIVFTGVSGYVTGQAVFTRISEWAVSDDSRPPDNAARDATLSIPSRVSQQAFFFWLGGAGVFMTLNVAFGETAAGVARLGVGIVVAGLTTAALTFVLVERTVRPLFALALAGEAPDDRYLGVRPRLMLAWALGSGLPLISIAAVISSPVVNPGKAELPVLFLAVVGAGAGWFLMFASAGTIADPLRELRRNLSRVAEGDLEVAVAVDDGGEVGRLQAGFNRMAAGLRERKQIEELFGRHVGAEVARQAIARQSVGGDQREVSALFVDLTASTQMALESAPADVVRTLNAFFETVVRAVDGEGGWVNKFQGDGALCVFGAPADQPDHAARALRAAKAIRAGLVELAHRFPGLDAGIGVSSGAVVAGNIGSEDRYEYTVIGDPVNEAARLTEVAKGDPGRVLASKRTIARAAAEADLWEDGGTLELRGRVGATKTFRPRRDP